MDSAVIVMTIAQTEMLRTIAGSMTSIDNVFYSYRILQKIKKCFGNSY